jgi:hypothetical protein
MTATMTAEPTPKQVLVAHLESMHKGAPNRGSLVSFRTWHARQHHHFATSHFHEGVNLGPGTRPPGWRTGQGAVLWVKTARLTP